MLVRGGHQATADRPRTVMLPASTHGWHVVDRNSNQTPNADGQFENCCEKDLMLPVLSQSQFFFPLEDGGRR